MNTQFQVIAGTGPSAGMMQTAPELAQQMNSVPHQVLLRRLEITTVLQSTLEVREIIELFAAELAMDVAWDGMSYRHAEAGICVDLGQRAAHKCTYALVLEEQKLGELRLMRRRRFSDEELALIESLLCALIYPLRNALMYDSALQAAHRDPLTGLSNRAALDAALHRDVELAHRHKTPFSVIVLDVDHFKSINDTHGHAVGDAAIRAIADCAARSLRSTDMIFRYGGEEFVVLLSNTDLTGALQVAERLRREVENSRALPLAMTASLGVASLRNQEPGTELLRRADQALYEAKRNGRNRVCVTA